MLFGYEWEQVKSPGGPTQWNPTDKSVTVVDAHLADVTHPPVMFTTDMALRMDPLYAPISKRFHENPDQFADAFARAWYKLTHRDMGPVARCLGAQVPPAQLWQDPVPAGGAALSDADVAALKAKVLASDLTIPQLVSTAWASASTFRGTDKRGGANGARVRLSPQKDWEVNGPAELATVLAGLEAIKGDSPISMADLIVLAGNAAVEEAAKAAGEEVSVPFSQGRGDATQEDTDVHSVGVLEPTADGFRNHLGAGHTRSAEELLVEKAQFLTLSAPEMTVLVGGLRVLGANAGGSQLGVFTDKVGTLTNDFFTNLLDMGSTFRPNAASEHEFEIVAYGTDTIKFVGSPVDLIFGSNSQLRAISEVYAMAGSQPKFVSDFVAAWAKVMDLDRFDL